MRIDAATGRSPSVAARSVRSTRRHAQEIASGVRHDDLVDRPGGIRRVPDRLSQLRPLAVAAHLSARSERPSPERGAERRRRLRADAQDRGVRTPLHQHRRHRPHRRPGNRDHVGLGPRTVLGVVRLDLHRRGARLRQPGDQPPQPRPDDRRDRRTRAQPTGAVSVSGHPAVRAVDRAGDLRAGDRLGVQDVRCFCRFPSRWRSACGSTVAA